MRREGGGGGEEGMGEFEGGEREFGIDIGKCIMGKGGDGRRSTANDEGTNATARSALVPTLPRLMISVSMPVTY